MDKINMINNEEFRMKVINMLKIYGYYNGCLVNNGVDLDFVNGEVGLLDIIKSKRDFKELKMSINKVLDYCYENSFDELERVINYFYKDVCREVRKKFGGLMDRFC